MNARVELAAALTAALPDRYKVVDAPRGVDVLEPKRPVVMVIRTNMKPTPTVGLYQSDFAIWVIEPKLILPEDDLDDALDATLFALDGYKYVTWDDAERSTFEDHPAYRIQATVITAKKEN